LNYDNILLKVYYDVASTNDLKLLLVSGDFNEEEATIHWEEIIRDNCKATNNRKYTQYMDARKEYLRLLSEQAFIKTSLVTLHFEIDRELIKELKGKGYRLDTSSPDKYAESLKRCEIQSKNLNTRITMQLNVLNSIHKDEQRTARNRTSGMQSSLVRIGTALGLVLPQDILLSTFNEHFNIVREQQAANRKKMA
jgi:hypothetical protein